MGSRIRYYRIKNNLSQRDLAKITGLEKNTIANCENDKFPKSQETIDRICYALNLVPSFIYDDYLNFISADVPAKIKAIRKELNLTQIEFIELTGLKTILAWERGRTKPSRMSFEILQKYLK